MTVVRSSQLTIFLYNYIFTSSFCSGLYLYSTCLRFGNLREVCSKLKNSFPWQFLIHFVFAICRLYKYFPSINECGVKTATELNRRRQQKTHKVSQHSFILSLNNIKTFESQILINRNNVLFVFAHLGDNVDCLASGLTQ